MLQITLESPTIAGNVNPGGSKSITNRVLIMRALTGTDMPIHNVSESNDTAVLNRLLKENPVEWNVQDAGTAARFSAAYLATRIGEEHILTGTGKMLERPMKPLIDALIQMGADITCLEKEGFLPIKITGKKLVGGTIKLPFDVSSQFVSALAMIAPFSEQDTVLEFDATPFSAPYIQMTLSLLSSFYIHHEIEYNEEDESQKIIIYRGTPSLPAEYWVEQDWSSASYWYAAIALADAGEIILDAYSEGGIQGDEVVVSLFDSLGISTRFTDDGMVIRKTEKPEMEDFEFDFSDYPDLAPTMAVVLPLMGMPSRLTGLHTLRHKESDRVAVIAEGLKALGISCVISEDGNELEIAAAPKALNSNPVIHCHGDHRMAMAFSQAVLKTRKITIDNPQSVEKSYIDFWQQMKNVFKSADFLFT